jgi:AAA ATPase domain
VNFGAGHPEATLLERESEVALLAAALSAARSSDGALVTVEGPAGIGKTRLLDAACERARVAGMTTLRAGGSELERGYGFGIARGLFEPVLATADAGRRAALLDGPARWRSLPSASAPAPGSPVCPRTARRCSPWCTVSTG